MTQATAQVIRLTPERAEREISHLADLLVDAVESGASVGFLPPLGKAAAIVYWNEVIAAVRQGTIVLLAAVENDLIQGAVQLTLETRVNGDHRAKIAQLLVHRRARRRGVAKILMRETESIAQGLGRTLLLLNVRKGSEAEKFFESLGYIRFGRVPGFARSADGSLHATIFFYRFQTPRTA